jgi:hypothetical protein
MSSGMIEFKPFVGASWPNRILFRKIDETKSMEVKYLRKDNIVKFLINEKGVNYFFIAPFMFTIYFGGGGGGVINFTSLFASEVIGIVIS